MDRGTRQRGRELMVADGRMPPRQLIAARGAALTTGENLHELAPT
jgi:hypothetical protein